MGRAELMRRKLERDGSDELNSGSAIFSVGQSSDHKSIPLYSLKEIGAFAYFNALKFT